MNMVFDYPPNIELIDAAFHTKDKEVLYAYGGTIFNPQGIQVPGWLVMHEAEHSKRQGGTPAVWWAAYLSNPAFRFKEEVLAHAVEFAARAQGIKDRNLRAKLLSQTAFRVIQPIYAYGFSYNDALRALKKEV